MDPRVFNELRTLPEGLAELVAKYLVAADRALVEEDFDAALAFVNAAKSRAGRVGAVREAVGVVAYLSGDFALAATELRAVRRMTGSGEYMAMLADCERGLDRPQKALELAREGLAEQKDPGTRVELLLVAAGARADLGQIDAAVLTLQVPELTKLPKGTPRARLQYAYADFLEQAGREAESLEWLAKAAESDIEGVTDAAIRLDNDGLDFDTEMLVVEPQDEG